VAEENKNLKRFKNLQAYRETVSDRFDAEFDVPELTGYNGVVINMSEVIFSKVADLNDVSFLRILQFSDFTVSFDVCTNFYATEHIV